MNKLIKKSALLALSFAGLMAVESQGQLVLSSSGNFTQGFEVSGDTWTFTANPSTFNTEGDLDVDGDEDVWAAIERIDNATNVTNGGPQAGSQYWGMQDLENTNGGQSGFLSLEFTEIEFGVGLTDKTISFSYYVFEWDTGDDLGYELVTSTNGSSTSLTGSASTILVDGDSDFSTSGWITETINLSDNVTNVSFALMADQNGGGDYGGFDSVSISAIPEPTTFTLITLGLGALYFIRRKRSA
jgi:hypothetical protein